MKGRVRWGCDGGGGGGETINHFHNCAEFDLSFLNWPQVLGVRVRARTARNAEM